MRRLFLLMVVTGFLAGCDVYLPSRRAGLPPGHGGIPPGHGGIPPGQAKKMGPPSVVLSGGPRFAIVPGSNVAVVLGVNADLFRVKNVYYYRHDGIWYRGGHYRGPWKAIAAKALPRGLRGKSPKKLKAKVKKVRGRNKYK